MERCKTCKHWEPVKNEEWYAFRGAGKCLAAPQMWDVTESQEDTISLYLTLKPEHAGVLAFVSDGSQYLAELVTMPDFGCVQHEALHKNKS